MSGTEEQLSFDFSEATQELSEVSLGELTHLCEVYASLKKEISEIEETVDTKKASMRDAGAKIMNILNAAKMPSIKNDFGNFIISNRFTVTTPKSPEEKEAFFQYLKQKGIFDSMVSVNSQTLNGWYREEMDAALDRGEVDFSVPGISEAKMVQTLSVRK